ncbi:MAG: hypothetical protein ACXABK_00625 [Candidatus Heimdallarchaeaceae archaeon]|jgi:hypothetical protein
MIINRKRITIIGVIISLFLVLSTLAPINTLAYDWNVTQSTVLEETNNIGYGVITGNHERENQYLEVSYDTDIRYVRENAGSITENMGNSSIDFRSSRDSSYYRPFNQFDYLDNEWKQHPTYLQAFNNTGYGPNVTFTTGVRNMGFLSLNSKTALVLEGGIYYVFKVKLKEGDLYDLNIKTTSNLNFYVYFNDVLSSSGNINGETRDTQPLFARTSGEYIIYLYTSSENDVIISPRELNVQNLGADDSVSRTFSNEPNNIWNETRQAFQENKQKETVHAYHLDVKAGTYQIKYVRFDPTVDTIAAVLPSVLYYESGASPTFMDLILGSFTTDKYIMHFEQDFTALIYIIGEYDNNDYIEFDYILSIKTVDLPVLESGIEYEYQDDTLAFGINIEQTQAIYINKSTPGTTTIWGMKYLDAGMVYGFSYTLRQAGEDAGKILLQPGSYFFMTGSIGTYDFDLEYNSINYEVFSNPMTLNLEQENGDPVNYKLIRLNYSQYEFFNYNFTFLMGRNYTLDLRYDLYLENYQGAMTGQTFTLGQHEDAGVFDAYPINNSQELSLFSPDVENVRYVLITLEDIYNNTAYSWPNKGDSFVNQTEVNVGFRLDPGYPDNFNGYTVHELEASLDSLGRGVIDKNFNWAQNDEALYIIKLTVPENTWYKVKVFIVNGTMDGSWVTLPNSELYRPDHFYRMAVYNRYQYKDPVSTPYIAVYDTSYDPDNVSYEVEFGVLSSSMVFMYAIDYSSPLRNGTVRFEFISYNTTEISTLDYGRFPGAGLSTGAIVGIALTAGLIAVGTITGIVTRVILPRRKTPSVSASPPQPQY